MKSKSFVAVLLVVLMCGAPRSGDSQSRSSNLYSRTDPRGPAELTVCSQNLGNFGSYSDTKQRNPALTLAQFQYREESLVRRFAKMDCDVVALQEILGKSDAAAEKVVQLLAIDLKKITNRLFDYRLGQGADQTIRNGFMVAKDRARIINTQSYAKVELPKVTEAEKPRFFQRGPLEIQIEVKGQEGTSPKTASVVTFHLKSKAGSADDPTGLEWETMRMQMAEALRRIVENRHGQSFASGETLLVLLGDRNSVPQTASAKILEGVLALKQFQGDGVCRLSKHGMPLCQAGVAMPQRLFSLLTTDPQTRSLPGTFSHKKAGFWIDDILVPAESLSYARADAFNEGDYTSGVLYSPVEASDHAMVWAKFNW